MCQPRQANNFYAVMAANGFQQELTVKKKLNNFYATKAQNLLTKFSTKFSRLWFEVTFMICDLFNL